MVRIKGHKAFQVCTSTWQIALEADLVTLIDLAVAIGVIGEQTIAA